MGFCLGHKLCGFDDGSQRSFEIWIFSQAKISQTLGDTNFFCFDFPNVCCGCYQSPVAVIKQNIIKKGQLFFKILLILKEIVLKYIFYWNWSKSAKFVNWSKTIPCFRFIPVLIGFYRIPSNTNKYKTNCWPFLSEPLTIPILLFGTILWPCL